MARILVAEDDASANKLISAVLRRDNHEVLSAVDGQDALDVLDHEHVDLIVSDVMMPRVDGLELVRQLREAGWDTPILMLTARQDAETLHGGFIAGVDDYLTKPADMKELVLRVRALLRRSGAAERTGWSLVQPFWTRIATRSSAAARRSNCHPRSSSCCSAALHSGARLHPACSCSTRCGAWDTESSEATVNVHVNRLRSRSRIGPTLPSRRCAASATAQRSESR